MRLPLDRNRGVLAAVEEFRCARGIMEPLVRIDWTGAFWRKGLFASRSLLEPAAM